MIENDNAELTPDLIAQKLNIEISEPALVLLNLK
jgi:hypothetical protein